MRIGKLFGVTIRLNVFFLLVLALYITVGVLPKGLIAFGVVIMHEMAHIIVSRGYGLTVKEVEILPFGGVARLEGNIELDPQMETYVALAGPLSNLFLIFLAWVMWTQGLWNDVLTPFFMECNVLLLVVNMLPVLPLDGGRIYRARLARRVGLKKATHQAARLGQVLSLVTIVIGLTVLFYGINSLNLIVVAIFLFYAAGKEGRTAMFVFLKHLTRKKEELQKYGIMPVNHYVATSGTPLKDVVSYIVPHKFYLVYVLDEHYQIVKTISEVELIKTMMERGIDITIGEV